MGETMGELKESLPFLVVLFVGFLAAALAIAAESTRIKVRDIELAGISCIYPSSPATILGYIAALLLLVTQVTISVVTRCACCQQRAASNPQSYGAIITFVISWITSITGILLLIVAASLSTRREFLEATGLCYTVKRGLFSAGGGLAIVTTCMNLCTTSFLTKYRQQFTPASIPYIQNGIVMGNQNPHFVHQN